MKVRQLTRTIRAAGREVEYEGVIRRAASMGCLGDVIESHLTPCTQLEAAQILLRMPLPSDLELRFGSKTGRAYYSKKKKKYAISLPYASTGRLRVGLVIHEAAHLVDHKRRGHFGHGPGFCNAFRELLRSTPWRQIMPTRSRFEIYMRHRGPFSLVVTREGESKKKRDKDAAEHVLGPFNAKEAHDKASAMVNDLEGNVTQAFVYSDSEASFIGAFYKRGEEYASYHDEQRSYQGRMELPDERPEAALLPGGPEPLRPVDAPDDVSVPERTVPADRPVRSVPAQAAAAPRSPRRPGAALTVGKTEGWPKAAAAQAVLHLYEQRGHLTPAEVVEAIGKDIVGFGVAHPTSLISRLKQAGHLKEFSE